jgi:acyl carrier protein
LGRGITDVQLLVLNDARLLAGIGELGEIYVRTPYLTEGYLDDAALTQERFLTNPFTNRPGDRLYKTGDVARYRPDGDIEFLGRTDEQVKVRGFRIEPGEIAAALRQHAAVREAAVIAREDVPGERRLVAYVVPASAQAPTASDLRRFLQATLPEYMLPAAFVWLDALPLTPNGKVDRGALPAPDRARPELEGTFVAPRTPVEEVVTGIWAEVLGLGRIGVHDNFFELGGHSLLATRVMARLLRAFQVEVPLRRLFEAPTVAGLAKAVEQARGNGAGPRPSTIVPVAREGYRITRPLP